MPVLYDPTTGQPVHVQDPAEAAAAVSSGKLGFLKDSKVSVMSPDGRRGTVPAVNVGTALSRGFQLAPDEDGPGAQLPPGEDMGDPMHQAGAGAAALLRGGTAGLSDLFLVEGAERPMKMKKFLGGLKEKNPVTSGVMEFAGTAASLGAGVGVPGAATKIAGATTTKLGGKVLAKAAGMGLEGGIYGLGQVVSENELSDKPQLTGEKLFAAGATGILTGAGLSLFGSGLAAGGKALMSKLGGKGMRNLLNEHANKLALRQYARPTELKKYGLNPEEVQKIGDYGHARGLFGLGADKTYEKALAQSGKEGNVIGRINAQLDKRGNFDADRFTWRAASEILDPMKNNPALRRARAELARYISEYAEYGMEGKAGPMSFSKAWELQSQLRKKIGPGDPLFGAEQQLSNLRQLFRDEIIEQGKAAGGRLGAMLQSASRRYRNAQVIEDVAFDAMQRSLGHRITSMSDMLFGIGGVSAFGPKGIALGVANHLGREYGGSIASNVMWRLSKGEALGKLGSGFKKFVDAGLRASPAFGGAFRAELERAAASGAADLLATHVSLANQDPSYLAAMGMTDETAEAANQYAMRSDQLASVEAAAAAQDVAMERAINRFLGKQGGRPPKVDVGRFGEKDYAKIFSQLEQMATNPQALMAAVNTGELNAIAPGVAGALATTAAKAVNYLYSVAPKNPHKNPIPAMELKWSPSDLELARWGRHVSAVQDPTRVLRDVEQGTLTWEQVDTLRNVYPEMLAQLQTRMMERMADYKKTLTMPQRTMISRLFGAPVAGVGDAKGMSLIQDMHKATMQPPKPMGASAGDGRQDVDVVENFQTQSQRIEARGST